MKWHRKIDLETLRNSVFVVSINILAYNTLLDKGGDNVENLILNSQKTLSEGLGIDSNEYLPSIRLSFFEEDRKKTQISFGFYKKVDGLRSVATHFIFNSDYIKTYLNLE